MQIPGSKAYMFIYNHYQEITNQLINETFDKKSIKFMMPQNSAAFKTNLIDLANQSRFLNDTNFISSAIEILNHIYNAARKPANPGTELAFISQYLRFSAYVLNHAAHFSNNFLSSPDSKKLFDKTSNLKDFIKKSTLVETAKQLTSYPDIKGIENQIKNFHTTLKQDLQQAQQSIMTPTLLQS